MPEKLEAQDLAVRRLRSSGEPEFQALLEIYLDSHPEGELKPASSLVRMLERPEYFFLVLTRRLSVAAFSISCGFPETDAALLEYMAVSSQQRGLGIGSALFTQTAHYGPMATRYLLIEVDSDKADSDADGDRVRRKTFYRRLGCREIEGLSYIMPRVATATPPPMNLLIFGDALPASIRKSRVRQWLQFCYVQVYDALPRDPRIAAMLEPLPEDVRLI